MIETAGRISPYVGDSQPSNCVSASAEFPSTRTPARTIAAFPTELGKNSSAHPRLPRREHNLKRRVRNLVRQVRHQPMQAQVVNASSLDVIHDDPARASQPLDRAAVLHAKTFVAVMLALKAIGVRLTGCEECERPEACAQSTQRKRPARRIWSR
jgi:hypothetical protein